VIIFVIEDRRASPDDVSPFMAKSGHLLRALVPDTVEFTRENDNAGNFGECKLRD
jgi:hypothetical protein